MSPAPHLSEPDAGTLAGLRNALTRAEYTEERVAAALGPRPPLSRTRRDVYLRRLAEAGDLGTLVRLFRLGEVVGRAEAAAALASADLDALVAAGLLEQREDGIGACIEVSAYSGLLLTHDRVDPSLPPASWNVLFGSASRTLAALTIRRPVRLALDLGTGCGVQALLAARHAESVVATDLAERPLTFTGINAALNEIRNVECRRGDLFEPVDGERFGLIVSNPPFVVSPDSELVFRDSGLPGDEISRRVVRETQQHLEDGGHGAILCSWICPADDHWSVPLRGWVSGDCDGLLLQFTSVRPLAYAAMWTENLDSWLGYYRDAAIEWISTGAVILRRNPSAARVIAFQATGAPRENAGDQLVRILDATPLGDASLLSARFRLVDHELRQDATYRDGAYTIELTGAEISGSPLNVRVEPEVVHLLARLDGLSTVAEVIDGQPVESAMLTTVRRLYERGFLVREG